MILTLAAAQAIDPNITQSDLDAFEQAIRALTNNKFQQINVRASDLSLSGKVITINDGSTMGLRIGDTVEVNYTMYNDGLYVVSALTETTVTVTSTQDFIEELAVNAIVTLIKYPADVIKGVEKLIEYDVKMSDKIGIKSETIARMSVTYYDVNATENAEGYPAALLSFLRKYKKMRW